jgi:PKHD-type hydroxylase
LTIIVFLSDESTYEGGDFMIQYINSTIKIPKKRGSIIIFPSFLTHQVSPVIKGIRNSLVIFAHGPPFA